MTDKYKTIIVGAGISGLTIANDLIQKGYDRDQILILEARDRIGGLIKTTKEKDYLSEWGPEGLRGNSENTQYIFDLIGLDPLAAGEESSIRYLVHDGKLAKVPSGPWSAITTPLISFFGKLRLLKEPFVGKAEEEETVAEFFTRRLGKGVFPIIDAFVAGIYGGDPTKLSIKHAFPLLKEFEEEKGSLIRGGMAYGKKKKKERGGKPKEKKPFLYSTLKGMEGIADELASDLDIELNQIVKQVEEITDHRYKVITNNNEYSCDNLVFATGVNTINSIDINGEKNCPTTDQSQVCVVALGFDQSAFEDEIIGYGYLSPSKEETFGLGTLFVSRLFPEHSHEDKVHLRCFVGGMRNPERFHLSEDELVEGVLGDLEQLLGLKGKPEYIQVLRHKNDGIPQMRIGHDTILNWREEVSEKYEGLYFAGVGWTNIACDGLIGEARDLVDEILEIKEEVSEIQLTN